MSDPVRAFLFVLVRDPETFFDSQDEIDLLSKCEELGFTNFWNSPIKTEHDGCEYTVVAAASAAEEKKPERKGKIELPVLNLRGGGFGVMGPLHASCKVNGQGICSARGVYRRETESDGERAAE